MQKLPLKRHLTTIPQQQSPSNNNNNNTQSQTTTQNLNSCIDNDDGYSNSSSCLNLTSSQQQQANGYCGGGGGDGKLLSSDKRKSRNENEKKRRDQFNDLIDNLAYLLNHEHKTDKSTTLFETLNFFKNYSNNDNQNSSSGLNLNWKPSVIKHDDELINLMCDLRKAFYIVFEPNGCIKFISDNISNLLGYNSNDVQEKNLFEYIDEKSSKALQSLLKKRKFNAFEKFTFECNWKLSNSFKPLSYESLQLNGFFKRNITNADSKGVFVSIAILNSFVGINEVYLNNFNDTDFISEFTIDWKFMSFDQKATQLTGYLPAEMLNKCGYDFCHFDDLENLIECHKLLLKNGTSTSPIYRFRTKSQQWIFLQTHYTLMYTKSKTIKDGQQLEAQSIYCNNHVININDNLLAINKNILLNDSMPSCSSACTTTAQNSMIRNRNNSHGRQSSDKQTTSNSLSGSTNNNSSFTSTSSSSPLVSEKHFKYLSTSSPSSTSSTSLNTNANDDQNSPRNNQTIVSNKLIQNIVLMSYKRPDFRKHVCTQFLLEKQKIESIIKQQQERFNQFDKIIKCFQDDKELEKWVNDIKIAKNLIQPEQQIIQQPQQQQQQQQPQQNEQQHSPKVKREAVSSTTSSSGGDGNGSNSSRSVRNDQQQQQQHKNFNQNYILQNQQSHHSNHQSQQQQSPAPPSSVNSNNNSSDHRQLHVEYNQQTQQQQNQSQNPQSQLSTHHHSIYMNPTSVFNTYQTTPNENIDIDDIDVEVLDRLLCEYSYKSISF